jgi:UMF1 family MFS transporter
MYDFANSGLYHGGDHRGLQRLFRLHGRGGAPWATFAWTCALAVSYALILVSAPVIGAYADCARGEESASSLVTTVGCVVFTAAWRS